MRAAAAQLNDPNRRLVATVLARLTDPVPNLVREELTVISGEFERDRPLRDAAPHPGIEVTPLREWHLGDVERPLTFLMGAAVLVALAASANVALVLIARTAHRRRELAIRVASGAGRARIVRQLLTESLLLAALGGVVGVLLAAAAARTAATLIPSHVIGRLPGGADALTLDGRVLFAAVLASLILGVVAGLASCSAFRLRRAFEALRDASFGGQPAGQHALQVSLVVLQTGVAVVLLVIASMLFGIAPLDAVTFALAAVGFLTVSLVAAILPARRAMAVSPVVALRTEQGAHEVGPRAT